MPNWCQNQLTVTGPTKQLREFRMASRGADLLGRPSELVFQLLHPMPFHPDTDVYADETGIYGGPRGSKGAWYDWHIRHWGTKWDLLGNTIEILDETDKHVVYEFDTAWSPPTELVKRIGPNWPKLTFVLVYAEISAGFGGKLVVKNSVIENTYLEGDEFMAWARSEIPAWVENDEDEL